MGMEPATPLPECHEGPEAYRRFEEGVRQALSVPRSTLDRRERAYKKRVAANPVKRGPKPKVTRSA